MEQVPATTSGTGTAGTSVTPEPASQPADERVERVLIEELGTVDSPEKAERVVEQVERLAAGTTSGQRADQAAHQPVEPGTAVELAAATHAGPAAAAAALTETAAQVVAPTTEAQRAARAAGTVMPPGETAPTPAARRGRRLLREAMLRRMGPFQRLDTRIFLAVNRL